MNIKVKKIMAVICAIAMVISSITVYNEGKVKADTDYSTLTYITSNNNEELAVAFVEGSTSSEVNYCLDQGTNFYCATKDVMVKPTFQSVTCNGITDNDPSAGAQFFVPMANLTNNAYNLVTIVDSQGNTYQFVIRYGTPSGGGSGETTTAAEFDPSTITDWTAVTNSTTLSYYIADGKADRVQIKPQVQDENTKVYVAYMLAAPFSSVMLDGTTMTPSGGAYVEAPRSSFTVGYHKLVVVNANNNETVTIYFRETAEETTTTEQTTAEPTVVDGTELLQQTAFASDAHDKWTYSGGTSSTYNGDGSVSLSMPAYSSGTVHDTQLVQTGITLVKDKWYKVKYTVSSDVAKKIGIKVQTNTTWTEHSSTVTSLAAGETKTVEVVFQATETTIDGMVGVMLGYVDETASEAANVTLSNISLKGYNDESTAKAVTAVNNVSVTGGTASIAVSWTPQAVMPTGTQYYLYLDDNLTTAAAIVTDVNSTTLTNVAAGQHIVTVKAYVNGVFSTGAESSYATVIAEVTNITNFVVSSTQSNQVEVSLDAITNASYSIQLINSSGETVSTITDCTVANNKATCIFTSVEAGTYTVRASATVGESTDTKTSDSVTVSNPMPQEVNDIVFDTATYNTILATWTVVNNTPATGQQYKVYLDGEYVATTENMTYTFTSVSAGKHTVKIAGILNTDETEGRTETVVATAASKTVFDTTINQVVNYGDIAVPLGETGWSYQYPMDSTDCYIGVDGNSNLIVYSPKNRGVSNYVYRSMTNLEIGKYYTYTYTVAGNQAGLSDISVNGSCQNGDSVNYTVTPGTAAEQTVVTRTFYATSDTITIRYDVGNLIDDSAVKISPISYQVIQPVAVESVTATGRVDSISVSWVKASNSPTQQTYAVYYTDSSSNTVKAMDNLQTTGCEVTGLSSGTYTITVKAVINGTESVGVASTSVTVGGSVTSVTSSEIGVEGFQIKTNDTSSQTSVAFRTVCKAPNVGSTFTDTNGDVHTVAGFGTVYAIDTNASGYKKDNKLKPLYTLLDKNSLTGSMYTGANQYDGNNRTYGYVATTGGVISNWNAGDTTHTYYVRTMSGMDAMMAYSMHIRAFVIDTEGNIIYGSNTYTTSVAQIGDYLYKNSMSNNYAAHRYLYNAILNSTYLTSTYLQQYDASIENNNAYYRDTRLDYGWNGNLYLPTNASATLTTNTLASLQD